MLSFFVSVHSLFAACRSLVGDRNGQSEKNKVVIYVECVHDLTFEIANYRPAGTEHVRELNCVYVTVLYVRSQLQVCDICECKMCICVHACVCCVSGALRRANFKVKLCQAHF